MPAVGQLHSLDQIGEVDAQSREEQKDHMVNCKDDTALSTGICIL